jgi:pimeloyl-ACP methyl ester carboxylesterase
MILREFQPKTAPSWRVAANFFPAVREKRSPWRTAVSDGADRGYTSTATALPEKDVTMDAERLTVQGIELEVLRRGRGRSILALHGFDTIDPSAPFLDLLARHGEVIAPSSPGFGHSPRPRDFDTVYDLVHLYLAASTHCRAIRSP